MRRVVSYILVAVAGQPQRLGQREGQDPLQPGAQRAVDQRPHPHGLRRQPDRLAARAPQQVGGVGVERVEVDDRERRIEPRGGGVQAGEVGVCEPGHGR